MTGNRNQCPQPSDDSQNCSGCCVTPEKTDTEAAEDERRKQAHREHSQDDKEHSEEVYSVLHC